MRTTRSTTRKSPLTVLLTALATLLGLLALAPTPAQAQAEPPRALATGLHISNGRLLEGNGNDFVMRGSTTPTPGT